MRHFFTFLFFTAVVPLYAQQETAINVPDRKTVVTLTERGPEEAAVRATINSLFDAMRKADSTLLKNTLMPGARLQTVINKQGQVSVKDDDMGKLVASVGKAKPGSLDERLGMYEVYIDGDLATAFTPYQFWYNGQQSHCGANAFTLVRTNGAWKVQTIIDTRRKCP